MSIDHPTRHETEVGDQQHGDSLLLEELKMLTRRVINAEAEARASAQECARLNVEHESELGRMRSEHEAELNRMRESYKELLTRSRTTGCSDVEREWENQHLEMRGRADHAEHELARRMRENARIIGALRAGHAEEIASLEGKLSAAEELNRELTEQQRSRNSR